MTIKEFLILSNVSSNQEDVRAQLEALPNPMFICGVRTPETLNDLTFGKLAILQGITTPEDFIIVPCRELLHLTDAQIMKSKAEDVLGFCMWVAKEVERINKLFASINPPLTSLQEKAGYGRLKWGAFGTMDMFARRMGIVNHEDVEYIPWVRIFKCMQMDSELTKVKMNELELINKNN